MIVKGLLKEFERFEEKLDEIVKEETKFSTFEELLDADKEDFEKGLDKVIDKLLERKATKQAEIEKKKEEFEEYKTGVMFKVYEGSKNGNNGFAVEARGKLADILDIASHGLADLLKHNTNKFDDVEDIICAIGKTIRTEFNKEEK